MKRSLNEKAINIRSNFCCDEEYFNLVNDIIYNPVTLEMKKFIQHGTTTCYEHCLNVSYKSYKLAKFLKLDYRSVARAGMLHDLFLYDWHKKDETGMFLFKKHGFSHPRTALNNALKYFSLNEIEKDCILNHMWPLTIKMPKYKEAYVIILMDKIACLQETLPELNTFKVLKKRLLRYSM